ncbi:MAG: hypothetical protein ACK5A0_09320 [Polaromonas sp.]|jgi:hypothetical protein
MLLMPDLDLPHFLFAGIALAPLIGPAIGLFSSLSGSKGGSGGGNGPEVQKKVDIAKAAQNDVIAANKAEKQANAQDIYAEIASKFIRFCDSDIGPAQIVSWKAIKSLDTAIANAKASRAQLDVTAAQNNTNAGKPSGGGGILGTIGKVFGGLFG